MRDWSLLESKGVKAKRPSKEKQEENRTNRFLLLPLLLVLWALVPTASPARSRRVHLACLLLLRVPPITKS